MVNKVWKIDTRKGAMLAILNPWQHGIISMIIEQGKGVTTGNLHAELEHEGYICSRASVINYCQLLAENDIVGFRMETAKGGYRRVYHSIMDWESIIEFAYMKILDSLLSAFPDSEYLKNVSKALIR